MTTQREHKKYYTGLPPKTRPGRTPAKQQAMADLKAAAKPLRKPKTVEQALAQCIEVNRARRAEFAKPAYGRTANRFSVDDRWIEAYHNLLAVIDPEHHIDE